MIEYYLNLLEPVFPVIIGLHYEGGSELPTGYSAGAVGPHGYDEAPEFNAYGATYVEALENLARVAGVLR